MGTGEEKRKQGYCEEATFILGFGTIQASPGVWFSPPCGMEFLISTIPFMVNVAGGILSVCENECVTGRLV